jgi:hypothetical protein
MAYLKLFKIIMAWFQITQKKGGENKSLKIAAKSLLNIKVAV